MLSKTQSGKEAKQCGGGPLAEGVSERVFGSSLRVSLCLSASAGERHLLETALLHSPLSTVRDE